MAIVNAELITKILVPRRQENVIHRQRLIDLLHEHLPLRLEVIHAPAGYGKTTLLVDFKSDVETPVCWYSLDISDRDPRLLLDGILASIRLHFAGFGQQTQSRLLVAENMEAELTHLVGTMTGEIYAAIPDYFVLILEDYHLVEDSEPVRRILDFLASRAPENCHIIISSRTSVELPAIATMRLQRRASSLGPAHLAFTPMEVKEVLAALHGLQVSDEQAEKLVTESEGWIAGILLGTYGKDTGNLSTKDLTLSRRDVFRYLVSEVYERQPPDIKAFLLASSTLSDIEPELCQWLSGIANPQKLLQEIERRNLFISRIDGEKVWYRYHHLFREFLQAKLFEKDPNRFALLHGKAASLLEQGQRWNDAITHFLAAGRPSEALRVIRAVGGDFLKSGKWTTVSKWIEALPRDLRFSEPELVLFHAQSLIHVGEVDEAARLLTDLLRQVADDEYWLYRAKALSWRSAAFRLTGHFAEARRDIETAIGILEQRRGPADILGDAYRRLGDIHAEQGRMHMALRYQRCALKQYTSIFDVNLIAQAHNSLGIIRKRLGDLTKANMHFECAREGWQKVKNFGALATTLNNIGVIYQCQGQYDLALETFRSGLEKAREAGYCRTEACIIINMAEVLRNMELYDDALTAYRQGLELSREVMEAYYVTYATAGMGETYRRLGAHDKAEVLLKEAISQALEQGQTYGAALFSTQLGIIAYERGNYQTATAVLQSACERLRAIGDREAIAKAYFHLAQTSFLSKKYVLALHWLEKASALADELGYEEFLVTEGRDSALLIQFAASKCIGGDRFERVMEKIRKRRDINRNPVTVEISGTPPALARADIEAHAFGASKVLVNGREISEVEWRSNKAKELFFYMLRCSVGQTKEQIIAALWPDLSPAKGTSNLHISLYRARRALFPGILALKHGRYRLNPDLNVRFDVAEFEALLKRAEGLPFDSEARATDSEQAIQLYQGAFLEEFYGEWTQIHRQQLEDKYLKAVSTLASFFGKKGQYGQAIELLEKLIAIDPYQDEAYCQIMEWHLAAGDRTSALNTYHRYLDAMGGDTGSMISARLQALHDRIHQLR